MLENTGGIMPSRFLKTHYRRGASVLTPEQIEEIRCLKNKVPVYMIIRNYHINKDHVSDIWDNCKCLQQSGEYVLTDSHLILKIQFTLTEFQIDGRTHLFSSVKEMRGKGNQISAMCVEFVRERRSLKNGHLNLSPC